MGTPHDTVVQLQNEGIDTVDDLVDFDKTTIEQVAANLRRPAGRIPDPTPGAAAGAAIRTPPFVFGAKSQKRLIVACELLRYYETVGRVVTAGNLQWTPTMKNFEVQWKALEKKKDDDPEVPKITKALPIIKWSEAFQDYLSRKIGVRGIPHAYVTRPAEVVPATGTIAAGAPHSEEHGSIELELVARASHTHPLFREDSAGVYYELEEATRATPCAASIKPHQRTKSGRGAWLALLGQHAGQDKWEAEIKRHEQLLHTRMWKGQSNFTLERFIAQHRNAFVSMQAAAEHVTYQLPNEHSRVGYLLEAISCSDAGLQAAMASVRTDQAPTGLRNDFEAAASHLLPHDPVAKKRTETSKKHANVGDTTCAEAEILAFGAKKGIGKTGVHLRHHNDQEHKKLTKEQRTELREWRVNNKQGLAKSKPDAKRHKADTARAIAAAVDKKMDEKIKAMEKSETDAAAAKAYIESVIVSMGKPNVASVSANTASVASPQKLKSILKCVKNGKGNDA